jgi:hypothetical protein
VFSSILLLTPFVICRRIRKRITNQALGTKDSTVCRRMKNNVMMASFSRTGANMIALPNNKHLRSSRAVAPTSPSLISNSPGSPSMSLSPGGNSHCMPRPHSRTDAKTTSESSFRRMSIDISVSACQFRRSDMLFVILVSLMICGDFVVAVLTGNYLASDSFATLIITFYVAMLTLVLGGWFIRQAILIQRALNLSARHAPSSAPTRRFTRNAKRIGVAMITHVICFMSTELMRVRGAMLKAATLIPLLCHVDRPAQTPDLHV